MMNAARFSLYALADKKGKTIGELLHSMTAQEMVDWMSFYRRQNELEQEEIDRMNTGVQLES
jgi:hypothetical protein